MMNDRIVKLRHMIFVGVLALILIVTFIASSYLLLNNATVDMLSNYTNELAVHDMLAIRTYISDRWSTMDGIYRELKTRNFGNITELREELHTQKTASEIDYCMMMDENGILYAATDIDPESDPFDAEWFAERNHFVRRYDDTILFPDAPGEYMLYGLTFDEPLVVHDPSGDISLVRMVILNDVSKIRGKLRITCFDGHGYTSIIDGEGYYIVPYEEEFIQTDEQNFFRMLENRRLTGTTPSGVKDSVDRNEDIKFWCERDDGLKRLVSVYSLI